MDRVRLRRATFELSGVLLGCPLRVPEDREELREEDQDGRDDEDRPDEAPAPTANPKRRHRRKKRMHEKSVCGEDLRTPRHPLALDTRPTSGVEARSGTKTLFSPPSSRPSRGSASTCARPPCSPSTSTPTAATTSGRSPRVPPSLLTSNEEDNLTRM